MKFWGGHIGNTSKKPKMAAFSENFLSGDDFAAVLAISYSYDSSTNASEAAEKITSIEKDYHKCPLCCRATVKNVDY